MQTLTQPAKHKKIYQIPTANRSRAMGMYILLKTLRVNMHQSYLACVSLYGRPMFREFAWSRLNKPTKQALATLRHAIQ